MTALEVVMRGSIAIGGVRLKCSTGVRPTKSIARQALADMLRPWLAGRACIDLFAGSGAVGITALREGAGSCLFVEHNRHALRILRDNIAIAQKNDLVHHGACVKILPQSVARFLLHYRTDSAVFIWADPPWAAYEWRQLLPARLQVGPGSYLAIESQLHRTRCTPLACTGWELQKYRRYGNTTIELLRKTR